MQLGRYQILKQLATGDVADVHLARSSGLEGFSRHVVLKAIRPELAREERLVEAFIEEARIAAALHHGNIVQVHDIGEQDGSYFFAMEYVHGEDVRKLLAKVRERGEQVPLEHVIAIITATAAGLHHAHEQRNPSGEWLGLVHRDVCPANILLGYDGSVKLVDFGMARAALRSKKTASGSLKGKASYMSPEQCCGRPIDRRTDTFALGIVLYELATARRLYKGANEFLTMAAIVETDVPPPSTHRPDLPAAFDEIVVRALARSPEARYQTAEDLREALERFAIAQELRTSNKALADYMAKLFGQRPEPWHEDVEPTATAPEFDIARDEGLVAAPDNHDELIAREAPRATAPIMLAQTMRDTDDLDDGWDDIEAPTAAQTASEQLPSAGRASAEAAAARPPSAEIAAARPPSAQLPATHPASAEPAAARSPSAQLPATHAPSEEPAATRPPSGEVAAAQPGPADIDAPDSPSTDRSAGAPSQPMAAAVPTSRTPSQPMAAVSAPSRAPSQPMAAAVPTSRTPSQPIAAVTRNPDQEQTRNERRPSAPMAAQEPPYDDDLFGQTIVAPPVFVDEDSTIGREPAELVHAPTAGRYPAHDDDDEGETLDGDAPQHHADPLAMRDRRASAEVTAPPHVSPEDLPSELGPPPRSMSEIMYVGPPAPPASRPVAIAQSIFGTYGRSIAVGATAGIIVLVLGLLGLRSCDDEPAAPPAAPAGSGAAR